MRDNLQILLVEDDPADARLIHIALAETETAASLDLVWVERLAKAFETLEEACPDAILLDVNLPDSQGLETVTRTVEKAPGVPIIVLTGLADEVLTVQALQKGGPLH